MRVIICIVLRGCMFNPPENDQLGNCSCTVLLHHVLWLCIALLPHVHV